MRGMRKEGGRMLYSGSCMHKDCSSRPPLTFSDRCTSAAFSREMLQKVTEGCSNNLSNFLNQNL